MIRIYKNKEDLIKDNLKYQKEVIEELNFSNKMIGKERKFFIYHVVELIICLLIPFAAFKLIVGEINIPKKYMKSRLYVVEVNNVKINVNANEQKKKAILPFVLNFKLNSSEMFYYYDSPDPVLINLGENIRFSFNEYICFSDTLGIDSQVPCTDYNKEISRKTKVKDGEYRLEIRKSHGTGKLMYEGKMIKDITEYLPDKGWYWVVITGKYEKMNVNIELPMFKIVVE